MNIKTLTIDDDHICHIIMKRITTNLGIHSNDFEFNGVDAIKFLESRLWIDDLPDIIFLDINMPYMNGWEFLEWYEQFVKKIKTPLPLLYVLSSSNSVIDGDFHYKYNHIIKSILLKPMTVDLFQKVLLDFQKKSQAIKF